MEFNFIRETSSLSSTDGNAVPNQTIHDMMLGTILTSGNRDDFAKLTPLSLHGELYSCDLCHMPFESVSCLEMLSHSCEMQNRQIGENERNENESVINESDDLDNKTGSRTVAEEHQCKICQNSFSTKNSLKVHMRLHSGKKLYRCHVCDKAFCNGSNLKVHMRLHTKEKPYQCILCEKVFSVSSNLKVHMRSHTEEKPYQSELCKKAFSEDSNLAAHMRVHTGEKPYQSKVCKKVNSSNSGLKLYG